MTKPSTPDPLTIAEGMRHCIALSRQALSIGQYPIAAAVVGSSGVLTSATSQLVTGNDPSAHPEMVAIRNAARAVGSRYLPGTFLVTTLEPCPMCTAAAIWAKMTGIAYAATQEDAVALGRELADSRFTFRQIRIRCSEVISAGEPKLVLMHEMDREGALSVMREFVELLS